MFSAFIVDDERMARGNLMDALGRHARWRVSGDYASGASLVADVAVQRPDVVFLDIQMPGDDGLSLAKQLLAIEPAPLIVFVTAHSEYAVTAFELYAVDYLLKPFDDQRFAQCVARLENTLNDASALARAHTAQTAWATTAPLQRIVIKSSTSVRIIDVINVAWLQANGNYVDIHHTDGAHLLRASLKHVLASLPPERFVQVHRSYAVRADLIREVRNGDGERRVVVLSGGQTLPVGKSYYRGLLERLC